MRGRFIQKSIKYLCAGLLLCMLFSACAGEPRDVASGSADQGAAAGHQTGEMALTHATQFHVEEYEDGYQILKIEDGLTYLLIPEGKEGPPTWLSEEALAGMTVIHLPVESVYLAASSAMDLFAAIDGLDSVVMTSTQAADWGIEEIREKVEAEEIHYIGKYSAPDYEALLEEEVDLAVESTMIYHSPEVKEEIEALDIPVLVERSSYENDPLGRLEWIRLYGLLTGKEEAADAYFADVCARLENLLSGQETDEAAEKPTVAFFSIQTNGSVTVRKPGDYVTKMIEMAGGAYALDNLQVEEENALSTMNLQMEAFYEQAVDADILIYNSAIEGDLADVDALLEKAEVLGDCKAVQSGDVWCTNKNVFQKSSGVCDMILEMHEIFGGAADDASMTYFHKLR